MDGINGQIFHMLYLSNKRWLLMGPGPGDMMRAYVFGAALSVCGVSPGLTGRTVVAVTRNLKVQMSPLALGGR